MKDHTAWVVIASSAKATIYSSPKLPKIEEVSTMIHPESRLHNQDLVSSKPGRSGDCGSSPHHAYEGAKTPHQLEVDVFAKQLAHHLSEEFHKGAFQKLYLFASKAFLGAVRQHLDPKLHDAIVAEINKDMTHLTHKEIEEELAAF